jgi:hypothetical protein
MGDPSDAEVIQYLRTQLAAKEAELRDARSEVGATRAMALLQEKRALEAERMRDIYYESKNSYRDQWIKRAKELDALAADRDAQKARAEKAERELEAYRMRLAGALTAAQGYHSRAQHAEIPDGLPWKNCPTIEAVIALNEKLSDSERARQEEQAGHALTARGYDQLLDDVARATRRTAELEGVVRMGVTLLADFVRQVEEFAGWDEKDWPAAKHALDGFAATARESLAAAAKVMGDAPHVGSNPAAK